MRPVELAVLVPIKAFHAAKARLAPVLDAATRERLARWTAEQVLRAAGEVPVFVACDDVRVAEWCAGRGATVLWLPGLGLNPAVDAAVGAIRARGGDHVVIAHADLPRPQRLLDVVRPGTVTLVPDRRLDGTNVRSFPLDVDLPAAYGPGSYRRHLADALPCGRPVEVIRHPYLSLDVDTPADLEHPMVAPVVDPVLKPTTPEETAP